jgi:dephospho-CoA kinase
MAWHSPEPDRLGVGLVVQDSAMPWTGSISVGGASDRLGIGSRAGNRAVERRARMLRVGLTGGIGSGKSAVSERLAALGAVILDADKAARAVVEPGTAGLARIAETFGPGVLSDDGSLDRAKLAGIVFGDSAALAKLNAIVHPLVHEHLRAAGEAAEKAGGDGAVIVHDVPLLAEAGRSAEFDLVIVVDAPPEVRLERLAEQRGIPADQARARMAAQATREQRLAVADIVIDNSGTLAELDRRVAEVWASLRERA